MEKQEVMCIGDQFYRWTGSNVPTAERLGQLVCSEFLAVEAVLCPVTRGADGQWADEKCGNVKLRFNGVSVMDYIGSDALLPVEFRVRASNVEFMEQTSVLSKVCQQSDSCNFHFAYNAASQIAVLRSVSTRKTLARGRDKLLATVRFEIPSPYSFNEEAEIARRKFEDYWRDCGFVLSN